MSTLEIGWTAYSPAPDELYSTADPLGFRAIANLVARALVPVVTQRTDSLEGFALLCLGLDLAGNEEYRAKERFLRFQRVWALAEVYRRGRRAQVDGARRAAAQLARVDRLLFDRPILVHELAGGIWGRYRKAAVDLDLLRPLAHGARLGSGLLTDDGRALARIAKAARIHGNIGPWLEPDAKPRVKGDLHRVGRYRVGPAAAERDFLSQRASRVDARRLAGRLGRLHSHWNTRKNVCDLRELASSRHLDEAQRRVAGAAQDLCDLMWSVEEPYRAWVRGERPHRIPPSVDRLPGWATLEEWDRDGQLRRIRRSIRSFDRLHEQHEVLSAMRGSEPWSCDDPTREHLTPPDYRLTALHRLFEEGWNPR